MTKQQYADLYTKKMNELVSKWKDDPNYDGTQATYEFEEVANTEEVVGYYVFNEGDNALKQWLQNIEGIELTDQDKKVTEILKELYTED